MKKMLIAITAFAATVAVAPAPAMAAATGHANYVEQINEGAKADQQEAKQRRHRYGHHNRWRWRTVCRRVWRYGRPHRVCRRVRVRW